MAQYALRFDGSTSWVVLRNVVYNSGAVTIEAIVQPDPENADASSRPQTLLGDETDLAGLAIGCERGDWVFSIHYRGGTKNLVGEPTTVIRGALEGKDWTHIAAVYDGQKMQLFVGGKLKETREHHWQHNPSQLPLVLGAKASVAADKNVVDGFRGMIRALRISNLPLYSQDFLPPADFAGGPATLAVFKFTEGNGDQIHDVANKKIVGEIHGAQWVRLDEGAPKIASASQDYDMASGMGNGFFFAASTVGCCGLWSTRPTWRIENPFSVSFRRR